MRPDLHHAAIGVMTAPAVMVTVIVMTMTADNHGPARTTNHHFGGRR
jgi:hypothetical protein